MALLHLQIQRSGIFSDQYRGVMNRLHQVLKICLTCVKRSGYQERTGLKREKDFEFLLIENTEREKLLKLKRGCNLAIDQVGGEMGGTGYGKNSIENLAIGLPTITEFTDDYLKIIPDNPFISCNIENLKDTLKRIIENPVMLKPFSEKGRKWVEKYHSFESVNNRLTELYIKKGIIIG